MQQIGVRPCPFGPSRLSASEHSGFPFSAFYFLLLESVKVSVVIPLYNKVQHIRRAVGSVLAQTYQDFELIVVDDGSTDGSGDVVRQFKDPRIRLIVQENAGVSAARNRGIREAGQELIAFLDADDEWLPCFLETVLDLWERYPEAGIYATAYRYSQGEITWRPKFADCLASPEGGLLGDYFRAALRIAPVTASSVLAPKHVLSRVGGFPAGIGHGEDLCTWAQIALHYRVAWSPVDGAVYHLSAENRACDRVSINLDFPGASEIEAASAVRQPKDSCIGMATEYLALWRLRIAWRCYLGGNSRAARSLLQKTRHTALFKRKRFLLLCLIWVPASLLQPVLSLRAHALPPTGR